MKQIHSNIHFYKNQRVFVSSLVFKVGESVAFKIEMKDGRGRAKLKGGDQIRAWLVDDVSKSRMAANVVDINNGTYVISASLLWTGKLR